MPGYAPPRCWICHEVFSHRRSLDNHYRNVHPEFYSWNKPFQRRLTILSAVPLILDPVLLALIYLNLSVPSSLFYLWLATFAPPMIGLVLFARVGHRYRREWILDHPKEPLHRHGYSPRRISIEGTLLAFLGLVLSAIGLAYHTVALSLSLFTIGWYAILMGGTFTFYGRFVGRHPFQSRHFRLGFLGVTLSFAAFAIGSGLMDEGVDCGTNSACLSIVTLTVLVYVGLIILAGVIITTIYHHFRETPD